MSLADDTYMEPVVARGYPTICMGWYHEASKEYGFSWSRVIDDASPDGPFLTTDGYTNDALVGRVYPPNEGWVLIEWTTSAGVKLRRHYAQAARTNPDTGADYIILATSLGTTYPSGEMDPYYPRYSQA